MKLEGRVRRRVCYQKSLLMMLKQTQSFLAPRNLAFTIQSKVNYWSYSWQKEPWSRKVNDNGSKQEIFSTFSTCFPMSYRKTFSNLLLVLHYLGDLDFFGLMGSKLYYRSWGRKETREFFKTSFFLSLIISNQHTNEALFLYSFLFLITCNCFSVSFISGSFLYTP